MLRPHDRCRRITSRQRTAAPVGPPDLGAHPVRLACHGLESRLQPAGCAKRSRSRSATAAIPCQVPSPARRAVISAPTSKPGRRKHGLRWQRGSGDTASGEAKRRGVTCSHTVQKRRRRYRFAGALHVYGARSSGATGLTRAPAGQGCVSPGQRLGRGYGA